MTKLALAFVSAAALASIGGCNKKKGGEAGADNAMAKMTELKDKMCACTDPDCAKKVNAEMTAWNATQASAQKDPASMSEADKKKATEIGTQMGECMQKAMNAGAPTAGSAAEATGSGSAAEATGSGSAVAEKVAGLPAECDEYQAAIEKLSTCDKISKQARETLIKAYADASAGWKTLPDAAKEKIAGSCKAGADSVTAMAKAQCGW